MKFSSVRRGGCFEGDGVSLRWNRRPLAAVIIAMMVCGCAAFQGAPKQLTNVDKEVDQLKKYFAPELLEEYDNLKTTEEKRSKRNEIANGRLAAIDLRYNEFKQSLYTQGVTSNLGFDLTTISLGVAGALSSGGTSQTLSGISAGVGGIKGSIDKNLFFEKTMPALLAEMDAQRLMVLARIRLGLDLDSDGYPLTQGLSDVEAYYIAGTIPGAVSGILKSSGEKAGKAEAIILEARGKPFFEKATQDRVDALRVLIDGLTDAQAIELEKNPPQRDSGAEQLLQATDPQNLRTRQGSAAKQALKQRLLLGQRGTEQLASWEATLNALKD